MELREQPHSKESESVVIGSCLLSGDGSVYDEVSQLITASDFYVAANKIAFEAIGRIVAKGDEVSELSLLEHVRKEGSEESVGGVTGIMAMASSVETPMQAKYAAIQVLEKSKLRKIVRITRMAAEEAYGQAEDADVIIGALDRELVSTADSGSSDFNMKEGLAEAAIMLTEYNAEFVVPHGIPSYDFSITDGGMKAGQMHTIGARPGCGKTTLALNIAGRTLRDGFGVGIFSLEMSSCELLKKMICMKSGLDFGRFKDKLHSRADQQKFEESLEMMSKWNLQIDDRTTLTPTSLASKARAWKRKHDIKIIIVDYLQLMSGSNKKENREQQVSEISRTFKCLAKDLKVPIIVLAQLNRECEKENRQPRLTDLRESGSIEQDSDMVTFLYTKKEDLDAAGHTNSLRWVRPKQRNGPCNSSGIFKFNGKLGRIGD